MMANGLRVFWNVAMIFMEFQMIQNIGYGGYF